MSGFNEVKLKSHQYLIKCEIHGDHISTKDYDKKNKLVNKCKYCIYQEKIYKEINNDKYFIKDKIFNSKNKILVNCSLHGNYFASPANMLNSKFRSCNNCFLEDNKNRCEEKRHINKKEKKCNKCQLIKSINDFNKYFRKDENKYRIETLCKECSKDKKRNYAKNDYGSEKYKARIEKYKNSVKYIEAQKNQSIKKAIPFINIEYFNCDNCLKILIKNEKTKFPKKICNECKAIGLRKKSVFNIKTVNCINCNKKTLAKNTKALCEDCKKQKIINYRKSETLKNLKNFTSSHKKRCKLYGGHYEIVIRKKLFKRDKYICKECGIKTKHPTKYNYNDLDCATIGHIIPLSLGGSHTYSNTQCECRNCNSIKGNRIIKPLQLKLNL